MVCGEVSYHDTYTDVILNPRVILEVLSPSTESFDRGEKFSRFDLWNPTLSDYLLVAQSQPQIEHYHRQADGSWSYHRYVNVDARVVLESIGCDLRVSDVYDRIEFDAGP